MQTSLPYVDVLSSQEAGLLSLIQGAVGEAVRRVVPLPGVWDDQLLKRLANAQALPGVYLAFERARRNSNNALSVQYTGEWSVVVAVGTAAGEQARKTGDATTIGAHALLAALVGALDGLDVAEQGSITCGEISNLFTGAIQQQGLAVYALALELPFSVDKTQNGSLDVFATFAPRLDMPQHNPADYQAWLQDDYSNSAPEARDELLVPQDALVVSAVFDQVHYWALSKAQFGLASNVREGQDLIASLPQVAALGAVSFSAAIEFDWYKKWGQDGLGCPAIDETFGDDGAPVSVSDVPTPWMGMLEAGVRQIGVHLVRQTIGAAAGYQAQYYAKPAIHRTAVDREASSSLIGRWQMASRHQLGAYSTWTENEPMHTLAGVKRGLDVGGQPTYPAEKPPEFQVRAAAQRTVAANDHAAIYAGVHLAAQEPAYTRLGFGSFLYGDFSAAKVAGDDEDDGGTDSNGKLGFEACVDALDAAIAAAPTLRWPDEIAANSYNGRWVTQLDGVAAKLNTRPTPVVIGQYAPRLQKKGPGDNGLDATPAQVAVARLSDLAAMLQRPDLARVHSSYWIGGVRALLDKEVDGSFTRTQSWHVANWWLNALPARRVPLYGLVDAAPAAGMPGVHAVAGLSARRAAVLLWNDGDEIKPVQLHRVALPVAFSTAPTTAQIISDAAAEPQPFELTWLGDVAQFAVPPWTAVLVEQLVGTDADPLERRLCLANATGDAVLVGAPRPFVSRARPSDYARYDSARHAAHMGLRGAGEVAVSLVIADAPDALWASAAVLNGSGTAGVIGVRCRYLDEAGAVLASSTLWQTPAAGLVAGSVHQLAIAAGAPAGWVAAGRVLEIEIYMADTGPNSVGELYLDGSSAGAAAPWA